MSIRTKIKLFLGFLLLTAVGNSILSYQLEKFGEEKLHWVNHTHEVLISVNKLLSEMTDAETGQRGFLLTKDKDYLSPYYLGVKQSKVILTELKELTQDNPSQQKLLINISQLMDKKFSELSLTIKLKQEQKEGEIDKALLIVKNNEGKELMDKIRTLVSEFEHTEKILLEQRKGNYKTYKAQIITLIIVVIMFFLFFTLFTISFLNKTLFQPMQLLLESTHKMQNGEEVTIEDIVAKDEMGYLLASFYKMKEKVIQREEHLTHIAGHDELTGLRNRTDLDDTLQNTIKDTLKKNSKCAILFIDLNKFKQLNDTLGHDAGDIMLKEVSTRLKKSLRKEHELFRIGGDEFLVLLREIKNITIIEKIISNILKTMKKPLLINNKPIEISLSIGVSIVPDNTTDVDELIKYADIAMYVSKSDTDTDYTFFDTSMFKRHTDNS
ncbi:MAG: diguanylate cyclase [Sulfurimonas sp.]|nr:diguanylate cyclase [Sulfurimonas sp.]